MFIKLKIKVLPEFVRRYPLKQWLCLSVPVFAKTKGSSAKSNGVEWPTLLLLWLHPWLYDSPHPPRASVASYRFGTERVISVKNDNRSTINGILLLGYGIRQMT